MNFTAPHEAAWSQQGGSDRLSSFGAMLGRHWRLAGAIFTGCVAAAIVLAFVLPSYWRVEIVVMPVSKSSGVNLSAALAGGLSSLGGLGGVGALLGQPSSNTDEAMAILRSRELFDTYATQKNLLPILYDNKWDAAAGRWNVPPSRVPTLRQAYKLFNTEIRDIDLDRRTGIVTLSITWKDRELAAQWARDLIALTNQQLRARAIEDAQRNMGYLAEEMRKDGAASAQNALTASLASSYEKELRDYMFAKGQPEFAFRVIDAPTIPDDRERVRPQRLLFAVLGVIFGILLGAGGAWLADYRAARRPPQARPHS